MDATLPDERHPLRVAARAFLTKNPDPSAGRFAATRLLAPAWPEPWGRSADDLLAIDLLWLRFASTSHTGTARRPWS